MPPKKEAGRFGLRLTMPGAANAPHTIRGVRGEYRPDVPTPVGGQGEMTIEYARKLDKEPKVPLELVPLDAPPGDDDKKED